MSFDDSHVPYSLFNRFNASGNRLSLVLDIFDHGTEYTRPYVFSVKDSILLGSISPSSWNSVAFFTGRWYLVALVCVLMVHAVRTIRRSRNNSRRVADFVARHGCSRTRGQLPRRYFAGLRNKIELLLYSGGDILDDFFGDRFRSLGDTYALYDQNGLAKAVQTIDPVNINAILSSKADNYCASRNRKGSLYPLAQFGLLSTEGAEWAKHRKAVSRLGCRGAKEVGKLEPDIQMLFKAIGTSDPGGWTTEADLLDLFSFMGLDMAVQHLLGTSVGSQLAGIEKRAKKTISADSSGFWGGSAKTSYLDANDTIRRQLAKRSKLGSKYWLADSPRYRQACRTVNDYTETHVRRAISEARKAKDTADTSNHSLISNLVTEYGEDPARIRESIVDLWIAGQNMTGTTAAWLFAELGQHPQIYQQIRDEVLHTFGTEAVPKAPMVWDGLRMCNTLQHAILETLRKYPALPNVGRVAVRDTVLPRGGGPDGSEPVAVPKGTPVLCCVYLMHRRAESWGDDAAEWRPERWNGRRFGPEYAPFGAGPRICLGQQLTMTELSYMTARMAQRFDKLAAPEGQDNLVKGYKVILQPENGVKLRLRVAV